MDIISPYSEDEQNLVDNFVLPEDRVGDNQDPLALEIPDEELVRIHKTAIEGDNKVYEGKYNLNARRRKNELYLFGRHIDEKESKGEFKKYESRGGDNVIYEIEASLKPLAMSHLPDMMILPGSEEPEKQDTAKKLSDVINDQNKKRKQRKILAIGFKHLPVYFTGILKCRWDPSLGTDGEERFDVVNPMNVIVSHTAKTNDTEDMDIVSEVTPTNVQELYMRFPKKKEALKAELIKNGVLLNETESWKSLATEVDIWEVHFTWYKKGGRVLDEPLESIFEPGIKWEKIECVMWRYGNVILDKMLDPNFDYEGEDIMTVQPDPQDASTKKVMEPQDMLNALLNGDLSTIKKEKIYHNYFKAPRKPYFFFGYDQWGKIAYDETSRIEQNLRNQENLDDQVKRIVDQIKQRIKHIWSKESSLKADDVQRLDMDNPNLDVLVDGDISKVHGTVLPERPDAAQYKSVQDTRERMYALSGSTAVRGQLQSDVATTNQIAREADFTRSDDLVEDTINAACEWMADWRMHMIKLRYTEDHLIQRVGKAGSTVYNRIRRDMVSDGMEVITKSSSTDKQRGKNNALNSAKLGAPYTDPISFFEDMGMTDPEGRAEKGVMYATAPDLYMAKYIMKKNTTPDLVNALNGTPTPQPTPPVTPPTQPEAPTPVNTQAIPATPPVAPTANPIGV